MRTFINRLFVLLALLPLSVGVALGQYNTLSSTTLTNAVTATDTRWVVGSTSSFVAPTFGQNGTALYVDSEFAYVSEIVNATTVQVKRLNPKAHLASATVYYGLPNLFYTSDPSGGCTSSTVYVTPWINTEKGNTWTCRNSHWEITATIGGVITSADNNAFTINSRNYTHTSGSSIGFQVKPNQAVANTDYIIGGEISPRIASGVAGSGIIGLHVDTWLRGTAAGTITNDVRTLNVEAYTDDAGTRTISGNVSLIRLRTAFSATTITGKFVPIRIEFPETQTNSKTYDAMLELTGTVPLVWNNDPGTEVSGSIKGYIGVLVNGTKRYIALYDTAPVD